MFRNSEFRRAASLLLAFVLFSSSGCAVWIPWRHAAPPELPPDIAQRYNYPPSKIETQIVEEKEGWGYVRRRIEFPLALPADLKPPHEEVLKKEALELAVSDPKKSADIRLRWMARMDAYYPKNLKPGEKRPAILISSILGGTIIVEYFAQFYAQQGYIAVVVHRKKLIWDEREGTEQIERHLRTAVIGLRQVVDWMEQQPAVDAKRLGAFGISYGAILHSLLAAVEPRIQYHILAMPAGSLAEVVVACPDRQMIRLVESLETLYGWDREQVRSVLAANIKTEPLELAAYVPRERIKMYVALFDRVVGTSRSFQLWKAMGRPALRVLPFGHYGGILILPWLQISSFLTFRSQFGMSFS